jgi:UDP-2-acetamido-2-deoxy-ribo-hexuluronate aminotransferase
MAVTQVSVRHQMVDLKGQYLRYKPAFDHAIQEVLNEGNFINGHQVSDFSQALSKWMDSAFVIPCANGTDALQLAYMALDLQPGDEILVPAFNYVAAAEAAVLLGLIPVFADVDPETFNLDPESARMSIGPKTKALVAVHLFGQGCNMEALDDLCREKGIFLIEDNAQAIGAEIIQGKFAGKKLGTMGIIGTTSFFPSKNLGCMGDGGALFCQEEAMAARIRMMANHGQRVRYQYDEIGINSRLDSIQAAVLGVKLPYLASFNQTRQMAAAVYDRELASSSRMQIPFRAGFSSHVFHQYTLTLETEEIRNQVRQRLAEEGVQSMIYYPRPLHLHPAYQSEKYPKGSFPVSENLANRVLSLPIHSEMTEAIAMEIAGLVCQSI